MNSEQKEGRVSRGELIAMAAIVGALLFVVVYANWQNVHRDKIESVTVERFTSSPEPSPSP